MGPELELQSSEMGVMKRARDRNARDFGIQSEDHPRIP